MKQEMVLGMVLSAMPVGEYDKRLVILTKEHGKIAAFARGARRPNSPLLSCSEPFSFGNFTIYQGRDSYTIGTAEISNYFSELRNDLEGAYYGFYFCEFASCMTRENMDAIDVLKLLYQTFRCLVKKTIPNALIKIIFELKMMYLNGEGPQVFVCTKCGKQEEDMMFSVREGGLLCESCRKKREVSDRTFLLPATVYTMQYIKSTPIEKLYTFIVKEEVLDELKACMEKYVKLYVNYELKTLEFLGIFS